MGDDAPAVTRITDESLRSEYDRIAGSRCVYGISDVHNLIVNITIDDTEVTRAELTELIRSHRTDLHGLQHKRIGAYADKLLVHATMATARTVFDGRLAGVVAMYVNENTQVAFVPICLVGRVYRSLRIGSLLLGRMEGYAAMHGMQLIRLITSVENTGARRFYERLGYRAARECMNEGRRGIQYEKDLIARGSGTSGHCD